MYSYLIMARQLFLSTVKSTAVSFIPIHSLQYMHWRSTLSECVHVCVSMWNEETDFIEQNDDDDNCVYVRMRTMKMPAPRILFSLVPYDVQTWFSFNSFPLNSICSRVLSSIHCTHRRMQLHISILKRIKHMRFRFFLLLLLFILNAHRLCLCDFPFTYNNNNSSSLKISLEQRRDFFFFATSNSCCFCIQYFTYDCCIGLGWYQKQR